MLDDEQNEAYSIYVLPSDSGPPKAIIGQDFGIGLIGPIATWSRDMGAWMLNGLPVPEELGEAITEHAKDLGVEW